MQSLVEGDEVIPTRQNKLQLQWEGLFTVTRKVTEVDYEVQRPGRRQEKIYHMNLLKKWHRSLAVFVLHGQPEPNDQEGEDQLPLFTEIGNSQQALDKEAISWLAAEQEVELQHLFNDFPKVTGTRTTLMTHNVDTGDAAPTRQHP